MVDTRRPINPIYIGYRQRRRGNLTCQRGRSIDSRSRAKKRIMAIGIIGMEGIHTHTHT
jgi:hypothetical protein